LQEFSTEKEKPRAAWRRWAGDFRVQLAAAYAVVALEAILNFLIIRPDYGDRSWFMPLYAYWDPRVSWWAVLAVIGAGGAILLLLYGAHRSKPWILGAGALLGITAVNLAPGLGRNLPFKWVNRFLDDARYIFQLPDIFSYYSGLTKIVDCRCRTRPGMTYWLMGGVDRLVDGNIYIIGIIFIIAAALIIPILYYGARTVLNKDRAPWAVALFAAAPTLLIFGSEPDGFYCLVASAVLVLGIKAATTRRPWPWAVAAGVALAVGLTTSFILTVLVPVLALVAVAAGITGREWKRQLFCVLLIFAAAAAALAAFQLATGYDHIAVFKRAYHMNQEFPAAGDNVFKFAARKMGICSPQPMGPAHRSYPIFVLGNLYAIFLFMGIPTAVLYARGLFRAVTRPDIRRSFYGITTIGFALIFVGYNFSGLVLGEVERIWLYLVPLFAVTAGYELAHLMRGGGNRKLPVLVIGLNTCQALIYNILIYSIF
jgi:4-amino-4-deoxy-L-arabinose transferase-like glycosyltransferase